MVVALVRWHLTERQAMSILSDITGLLDWVWPKLPKTWQASLQRRRDRREDKERSVEKIEEQRRTIQALRYQVQVLQETLKAQDACIQRLCKVNDEKSGHDNRRRRIAALPQTTAELEGSCPDSLEAKAPNRALPGC